MDCGYSSKGFDPNLIKIKKYQKGIVYRLSTEEYPKVTYPYLRALFNDINLNAPTEAPNLYLSVPGTPKFMEKPSISDTVEFRRSVQLLESGEDLAPDQAKARATIKMDPRIENLNPEERLYLEGAAAGLAVSMLRSQDQMVCKSTE